MDLPYKQKRTSRKSGFQMSLDNKTKTNLMPLPLDIVNLILSYVDAHPIVDLVSKEYKKQEYLFNEFRSYDAEEDFYCSECGTGLPEYLACCDIIGHDCSCCKNCDYEFSELIDKLKDIKGVVWEKFVFNFST